jgi:aspartyl-tRNA(Asn)/glutamyl-tRNA(Gln) amidotransferase subunit A
LGSDTAGSVRNPATACAIVGMKPTYGRVSRHGVVPLAYSLDTLGPMTRSVAENAAALALISGHDSLDPSSLREPTADFAAQLNDGVDGLRVGYIRHFHTRDMTADEEVASSLDAAAEKLSDLGAEVVEIETRPLQEFASCNRIVLLSEAFSVHEHWLKTQPQDYADLTRNRLFVGAFFHAADYIRANRMRRQLTDNINALFDDVDIIICASSFDPPCQIDDTNEIARTYARQARAPFNVTGQPALALPCGFTSTGLPIGLQVVGAAFDEARVYRVAQAYEQATDWSNRHPPLPG